MEKLDIGYTSVSMRAGEYEPTDGKRPGRTVKGAVRDPEESADDRSLGFIQIRRQSVNDGPDNYHCDEPA